MKNVLVSWFGNLKCKIRVGVLGWGFEEYICALWKTNTIIMEDVIRVQNSESGH